MNRAIIGLVIGAMLVCCSWASAALCEKCQDMMFIDNVGTCKQCGAQTSSGAFKLCAACSAQQGVCQACGAKLAAGNVKPGVKPGVKPPVVRPPIAVDPIEVEVPVNPTTQPSNPTTKPATQPGGEVKGEQGVFGKVTQMRGDFMPGPGPARGKRVPLNCTVNVYAGKVQAGVAADKRGKPVASVQSDKDGNYRIALQPGLYTVVAETEGGPSIMDGDGNLMSVTVEKGKWLQNDIVDSSQATF